MVELFVFTFNGAYLKAVVNAYRQLVDTFVFHFTRENIKACVMSTDRAHLIEIVFTPYDYRAYVDEVWVQGDMGLLWGAVKKLKKAETVTVRVEDDKFYVGALQPGEVVSEEWIEPDQKFDIEFPTYFEQVVIGSLHVVVAGFKKILRSAPPDTQFLGFDIDEPGGHIILGKSILDIGVPPLEWLLEVSGSAREGYTLGLFTPLLVSGLIEHARIHITEKGHAIVEYAEDQCTVKLYMAPIGEGTENITAILEKRRPVGTEILRMWVRVDSLFKAVKAIGSVCVSEEVTVDPTYGLGIYWDGGYLKVPSRYLETWTPPPEPTAGFFSLEGLVKFLKDVEDLSLFLVEVEVGEMRLVLRGTGPKIAPKELEAFEMKIEVPEVVSPEEYPKVIFAGPVDLLLRTVEDAKVAEDNYLVFYTTPYEIEAFGRNEVYYEATFELNDFQAMVEEDYIPIGSDAFSELIGFFKNVPADWCGMGKTEKNDIFLSCATDIGEFRGFKTNYMVKEAIAAYEERIKRPVAPPEAEKLPEAPPPVAPPPVMEYPSEVWNILYTPEAKKPYCLEFNIRGTWNPVYFETFDELAEFVGKGHHKMYIHIIRGEGDVVWTPFSLPPFAFKPGDEIDTPEKRYALSQPSLRSETPTEWVWTISVYDKEAYRSERAEMTEGEWREMRVKPPPLIVPPLAPPAPSPEKPSLGELYLKYYAEALERHEAEVPPEEENEIIEEAPAEIPSEVYIEEVAEPEELEAEEPSAYDQYMKYYKEALARHTTKT